MGKADSERMNLRLKSEARFALEELAESIGISKTAVIERAIMAMRSSGERFIPDARSMPQPPTPTPLRADPVAILGVSQGMLSQAASTGTEGHCVHHNGPFQIPDGARKTSICRKCYARGHQNVESCKKCAEDEHFRKQAEASTSCEPEGIEFNMDWGA